MLHGLRDQSPPLHFNKLQKSTVAVKSFALIGDILAKVTSKAIKNGNEVTLRHCEYSARTVLEAQAISVTI